MSIFFDHTAFLNKSNNQTRILFSLLANAGPLEFKRRNTDRSESPENGFHSYRAHTNLNLGLYSFHHWTTKQYSVADTILTRKGWHNSLRRYTLVSFGPKRADSENSFAPSGKSLFPKRERKNVYRKSLFHIILFGSYLEALFFRPFTYIDGTWLYICITTSPSPFSHFIPYSGLHPQRNLLCSH